MRKVAKFAKKYWQFVATVAVGIVALGLAISAQNFDSISVKIVISAWSAVICLTLSWRIFETLRAGNYGVDVLALTAIVACVVVGQFWAALVIALMLTGGETLEDYAAGRADRELAALLKRAPRRAHRADGSDISVAGIAPGDEILVRAHEIVPADGELLSERAEFDESSMTGESMPALKKSGDLVASGLVNGDSPVLIRVRASAKDSQYEKIITLVRESQKNPAPFVRLADRYSVPFTVISYLIAGAAWYFSGSSLRFAEVLVVASPCPLILAAPIALISGMSLASRYGIIVKNGAALEKFAAARAIAFDKTGTLTQNLIEVAGIYASENFTAREILALSASAENGSAHVLARSLTEYARRKKVALAPAKNVREIVGTGVYAMVARRKILVGSADFLRQNKIENVAPAPDEVAVFVAVDGKFAGRIAFADKLRADSAATIRELRSAGLGQIVMLTGDKSAHALALAKKLEIGARAELSPAEKVREIKKLRAKFGVVGMVGDGVNDAPVLASADVGIAMAAHDSTAASQSADVVILANKISRVALFRRIAERTLRVANQSVWSGILLCVAFEIVAACGVIPAIVGAALQELIDVSVIFNALRAHSRRKIRV